MTLRVYNTLTRKKEEFQPITPGKVRMYVCGPTVYDYCHIGHARSVVVFDVVARYFREKGLEVTYVRNFTDVDDKIINKANATGMTSEQVAEKFIEEFYKDMGAIGIEKADIEPRATEHIDDIINVVKILIEKGHAYELEGDVYFEVSTFESYGKLSGRKLEDMEAGARVGIDERKRSPHDFALWKSAKPGEPLWESPWGKGRPGWHIECSAMSKAFLGESFDIHGGGKDLVFPHHENEIAQSEAAFGVSFAKYWMHNGFVNINSEKMSKSLGNFLMIKDVLKSCHPEALRVFLLSSHYRNPVDYTHQYIEESESGLEKIYALLLRIEESGITPEPYGDLWERFCESMDDDFNTAKAIGFIFDSVRNTNRILDKGELDDADKKAVAGEFEALKKIGRILGLFNESPAEFLNKKKSRAIESGNIDAEEIEKLIVERRESRKAKNFARADEIRKILKDQNIVLEDKPDGTTIWKIE
ncbi:cysteine--tRNA ligase [Desulforegula conservatrix]|uniref:cysteine--tRNA ligase n=1 Tax=Desulforegula conservatrix TaxID=153026 RepID=UPI000485141B|nr:cysteine--tRNA ligase [Desulforegula conservatrix]